MKNRPPWLLLGLGALVVLVLFTYPTWRKFLPTRTGSGSTTDFSQASAAQRDLLLQMRRTPGADPATVYQSMLTVVPAPTSDVPTPDSVQAQPIKSGDFLTIDPIHTASGHVTLYRLTDNSLLLRFDDFSVTNGPSLNVYLCAAESPLTAADLATGKLQLLVAPLKGSTGAQNYTRIPPELDLSRYKSVVIFSETLQAIYSSAPLR